MGEEFDPGHSHEHDGIRELGVVCGHDEIAGPTEHKTCCDAFPLHRSDRGLHQFTPPSCVVKVTPLLPVIVGVDSQLTVDSSGTEGRITAPTHVMSRREVLTV